MEYLLSVLHGRSRSNDRKRVVDVGFEPTTSRM